jgi:hypothetical protein
MGGAGWRRSRYHRSWSAREPPSGLPRTSGRSAAAGSGVELSSPIARSDRKVSGEIGCARRSRRLTAKSSVRERGGPAAVSGQDDRPFAERTPRLKPRRARGITHHGGRGAWRERGESTVRPSSPGFRWAAATCYTPVGPLNSPSNPYATDVSSPAWSSRRPRRSAMRGRSSAWTRIRIEVRHVPESECSAEQPPDPTTIPGATSGRGRAGCGRRRRAPARRGA